MADERTQVNVSADIPPPKKEEPKKIPGTDVEIHPNTTDTGAGEQGKSGGVNVVVDPNAVQKPEPAKPEVNVVVDPSKQGPGQQQAGAKVEVQQAEGDQKPKVEVNVKPAREPGPGQAATDTKTF